MVTRYGMSDQFGMVALETVTNQYLGGDTSLACSPETAKAIDDEVIATVKAQYEKAMGILRDHAAKLKRTCRISSREGDNHRGRIYGDPEPVKAVYQCEKTQRPCKVAALSLFSFWEKNQLLFMGRNFLN